MKKLILPTLTVLICALVIAVIPTEKEAAIYEDTVRLHIIAASDEEEDQALKLLVRDEILAEYGAALGGFESADEAEEKLAALVENIAKTATRVATERGFEYGAKVSLGKEYYPTREYESFSLPSGVYTSLIVVLGEGEGKNWWCVMYPPMCLDACVNECPVGYTSEEYGLISGGEYRVKFKLLELLTKNFR